jgi:hypothetical protein
MIESERWLSMMQAAEADDHDVNVKYRYESPVHWSFVGFNTGKFMTGNSNYVITDVSLCFCRQRKDLRVRDSTVIV